MDPMVVKYVGLSGLIYGLHGLLAFAQIALGLFLIANGALLFSNRKQLGKWENRFGLILNTRLRKKPLNGWLMILTGTALFLPILGLSYWIGVVACVASIYWLFALRKGDEIVESKRSGKWIQKGLVVGAVSVLGFTLYEGKDLVRSSAIITYKAAYWEKTEVMGWQKQNNPNAPKVGELAPDFELTNVAGTEKMRLSDLRGEKPVVLLFGSFT